MAFPFKSGGDFYTQELLRVRLQNFDGDLPEYGTGSIYHNTSTGLNTSDRIRYRGKTKWYSVANMDDIQRLENLIAELDFTSSGDFTALIKRVQSVEDNFTDGKANDSAKLGGQLPSYYATQSAFSALQEKVNAFLDGDVDSDAVLENLKEIQAFLDNYDGATSLADMFDAVDAKLADRYTKDESDARYLQLTGGMIYKEDSYIPLEIKSKDTFAGLGFKIGDAGRASIVYYGGLDWRVTNEFYQVEHLILHQGNYSNLITDLNNNLNVPSITIGGITLSVVSGKLQIDGDVFATGEVAAKGKGQEGGENTGGGFQLFDETNSWDSYEASMQDWILTAYHGKLFNDRISLLENKATKVEVSNLLPSGTKIATIKVDNNSYNVLAPFADAYTKTESDGRYLQKIGGRLNIASYNSFVVDLIKENAAYSYMQFSNNGVGCGYLGFSNTATPAFMTMEGAQYSLLHANNYLDLIGDTYLKSSNGAIGIKISPALDYSDNMLKYIADWGDSSEMGIPSATYSYGIYACSPDSNYAFQLALGASKGNLSFRNKRGGIWYDWKTLAFTDSDITGNAASATKLKNSVSLWGNSFDGTQSLSGALYFNGVDAIEGNENSLSIGWGYREKTTDIYGGTIRFRPKNVTAMTITEEGKVLVGTTDGWGNTLTVNAIVPTDSITGVETLRNTSLFVGNANEGYGSFFWTEGSGKGFIQQGRCQGANTLYALNLNPLGGNVGIGTTSPNYKLHVDGDGYFSSNLYIGGHIVSKLSDFYMFYDSSKIFLQAGPTGVFLGEGTQDTTYLSLHGKYIRMVTNGVEKMRITEDGTVRVDGSLTAGATTLSSLIVNNAATFNGGVDIPMGQSLKIGDATIKYEGGALKVDKSIHSEGEVSAKGKGTEGAGGTTEGGGNAMKAAFNIPMGSQSHICEHNFHTREVTVCIYEDSGDYQQVLADVYLDDENNVRIQFGSATDVPHRVIIMA